MTSLVGPAESKLLPRKKDQEINLLNFDWGYSGDFNAASPDLLPSKDPLEPASNAAARSGLAP
ncbi:MAG: hypothetical protein LM522_07265 [Candidatus Contendobacter sp.]|nr:hypothetical protein [Candidatus Contendobacter sp.]